MSELLFSDSRTASSLSRAAKAGKVRRLAHGVYTAELRTEPAVLLRRNWPEILAHYCAGAIIADRSVPLAQPDPQGHLFVIHPRPRPITLPGLTIVPRTGEPPLEDDLKLPQDLWLSSRPRALLENLRPSRAIKGRPRRTLTRKELHEWLVQLRRTEGIDRLNRIRDRARELAPRLGLTSEFPELDDAIGAALGTRQVETQVPGLAAVQRDQAYDERRERTLVVLAEFLAGRAPSPRPMLTSDRSRSALLAFFEAYFSNFIEGTEFTVDEAARIVFENEIPLARPADAYDVLGTYRVVADDHEMGRRPQTADELLELLSARHACILTGRPDHRPGLLKERANRAGSTEFVPPELVKGTLSRGFELLQRLEDPFARAVFTMFLVSEVHPFDDGNGRVARVMMNAELHAASEQRIVIPTVYRNEYLSGLRALTHNTQPGPMVRVLDFAQRYTAQVDWSTMASAQAILAATHAFEDSTQALERGVRLTLPSAVSR